MLAYCALQPLVAMLLSAAILAAGGPRDKLNLNLNPNPTPRT